MIYGNKEGIRDSLLAQMETLYDLDLSEEVFAPAELLDVLAAFTCAINREISIYVSRSGAILDITIGGLNSVDLKDMHLRRNTRRLSMIRCIIRIRVEIRSCPMWISALFVPCILMQWQLSAQKMEKPPAFRRLSLVKSSAELTKYSLQILFR